MLILLLLSLPFFCIAFEHNVTLDNVNVTLFYDCDTDPDIQSKLFCTSHHITDTNCNPHLSVFISRSQGEKCGMLMEDWLDRPVKDWLERLQWRILDQSTYHGVTTWKFPFDIWMYRELLYEQMPTVVIEIGNFAGGSALFFADLFDTMNHYPAKIIAVDIDHSNLHDKSKSHPRITWIEADAIEAFEQVAALIDPIHDRVMVIEDASHRYEHTLEIMKLYGNLVTNGSYMIIEDTVLHNGVRNEGFTDPGAFASVRTFLELPDYKCGWKTQRNMERFVVSWNPTGFLQKIHPDGACQEQNSPNYLQHNLQQYHQQWISSSLDYDRYKLSIAGFDESSEPNVKSFLIPIELPVQSDSGSVLLFDPVPQSDNNGIVTMQQVIERIQQKCIDYSVVNTDGYKFCNSMILSKLIYKSSLLIEKNRPVILYDWEINTPVHVDIFQASNKVAAAVKTIGVAMTHPIIDATTVNRLRNVIINNPKYMQKNNKKSRYLDPLCSNTKENAKENDNCHAWDDGFIELVRQKHVLTAVESILGTDCIVDSTAISIQWPGDSSFGPHVDRPFLINRTVDGEWPYSSQLKTKDTSGINLPPMNYPISVQVLWLLDHFSTSNGAFYYIPTVNGDQAKRGNDHLPKSYPRNTFPKNAQMITGESGSVLFAHGGILHGAAPNMHPRPRIAFLVQYVPKFVRPGNTYPFSLLTTILSSVDNSKSNARLKELFDIKNIKNTDNSDSSSSKLNFFVHQETSKDVTPMQFLFPTLAFGVGTSAAASNGDEIRLFIRSALVSGLRHFDLAEMYGNHKEIGILFNELWGKEASTLPLNIPPRSEVYITSKLWTTNMNPKHTHSALLHTLKELQLSYLDLWLIHWPIPMIHTTIENPSLGKSWPQDEFGRTGYAKGYSICDTWNSMEKSLTTGLIQNIGVSNFSPMLLQIIIGCSVNGGPIVNQVESHPYLPQTDLLKYCQHNGIIMQAYSPLANGKEGTTKLLNENVIVKAALNHQITSAQVVMRWNIQRGVPIVSTTRRMERMNEMINVMKIVLTEEEMQSINEITFRKRYVVPKQFEFAFL